MWRKLVLSASLVAFAGIASGAEAPKDAPGLEVTIYNADLALVRDARQMDIGKGRQRLEFKDVSSDIRPETVTLAADGVDIVEQNYDFDLLTPSKLMEKAVGQQIQIVRTNPGNGAQVTETATVLAANEGVVLKIGDRIEVLRDDGAGKLDLQGWVTLTNSSGTSFVNADTKLVAGEVQLSGGQQGYQAPYNPSPGMVRGGTESNSGPGRALGDYYIYSLPERTTLAQNQTKQVSFLDANGVAARKVYQWNARELVTATEPSHAVTAVDFANSSGGGLGSGLPAGVVRIYERDAAGAPKFVGETEIGHTPQGSELSLKFGDAFDVTVQPTLTAETRVSSTRTRYAMSYLIRNAKAQGVTVEVRQSGYFGRNTKVISESLPSRSIDAYTLGWSVPAPANGQAVLTSVVETGW